MPELPESDDLVGDLIELAVPFPDLDGLTTTAQRVRSDPELGRLCGELADVLAEGARLEPLVPLPALPAAPPVPGLPPGYLEILAMVLAAPATRAAHAARGVDPEITRRTLADVGRNVMVHRAEHHQAGFSDLAWLQRHLAGRLFELGRLQFEIAGLGGTYAQLMSEHGLQAVRGEPVLSVHIPRYAGPLTAELCDRSVARSHAFFAEHFPELSFRYAVCSSWLLDPELGAGLSERSNIRAFQDRFTIVRTTVPDDEGALKFVFADPTRPLASYPQDTSLQRLIVGRLVEGSHWHGGRGWFAFEQMSPSRHA